MNFKDEREKTDPYWAMMKDEKDKIVSMQDDEFALSKENLRRMRELVNSSIGRYP